MDTLNNLNDSILGFTGFVGSHIRENLNPDTTEYFNSQNFKEVKGRSFNRVYCTCVPAIKWWANKNPNEDLETIEEIKETLKTIKCNKFFLISTIDVHDHSVPGQYEDNVIPSPEPYGKHRYELEQYLRSFLGDKLFILRLPALFGNGLKKNYIFDLMNDNNVEDINMNSSLQWYSMTWLWEDILTCEEFSQEVVNLYSEPIETSDIVKVLFENYDHMVVSTNSKRISYNHSSIFGIKTMNEVMDSLMEYIELEKYKKQDNKLVISNMAWEHRHDEHAAFLMQRHGINKLEILPTKFGPWEHVFNTNLEKQLSMFEKYGVEVYSVQSVLYRIDGSFGDECVEDHLKKVVKLCENIGAKVIVMGTPKKRVSCKKSDICSTLGNVQESTQVKICLEPNSKEYGCQIGTNLDECKEIKGSSKFHLNYDTGNALMEKDRLPELSDDISHIQISRSFLQPLRKNDYTNMSICGITESIRLLRNSGENVHVSLETVVKPHLLSEQMRRFTTFMCFNNM